MSQQVNEYEQALQNIKAHIDHGTASGIYKNTNDVINAVNSINKLGELVAAHKKDQDDNVENNGS